MASGEKKGMLQVKATCLFGWLGMSDDTGRTQDRREKATCRMEMEIHTVFIGIGKIPEVT